MKFRKMLRSLALVSVVGAILLSMLPAHAGTTILITDSTNDVIDIIKHTQNSFRPSTSPFPSPNTSYQHACTSGSVINNQAPFSWDCNTFDLKDSQVTTDPILHTITFTMHTVANIPPRGAALDSIPQPFNGLDFAWYFGTSAQEQSQVIGINCTGVEDGTGKIRDNGTVKNPTGPTFVGAELVYTPNTTCPDAGIGAAGKTNEAAGTQQVPGATRNVLRRTNVTTVAHPKDDGWQAFVEVAMTSAGNGSARLDGNGNLACAKDPATGQPALACIDYDMSIGSFEGYSGVSSSDSLLDFDKTTQSKMHFDVIGNTITATIPWNPTVIAGTDGDLVLDDARSFPWPIAVPGQGTKMTQLTAEVSGLISVGADSGKVVNAVCTDDTDNVVPEAVEPIRSVGKTVGDENRAIGDATNAAHDAAQPDPDDNGIYVFGNGGHDEGDCVRGVTGLLTFLDWTDNGAELRIYPRQPGYLPSASGVDCRYPIGQRPLAFAGVANVSVAAISEPSIDVNSSPYDHPYKINVYTNSSTPTSPPSQSGPIVADPMPTPITPLNGAIGKDKKCGYTYWAPGIHYFDILPDFVM